MDCLQVGQYVEALKNEDSEVSRNACIALGQIGDAAAVPSFIEALKDNDRDVRMKAAAALVKIGCPAVPALIDVLKVEAFKDEFVREQAISALVEIGSPAVPALIETLKDAYVGVRRQVISALEEIGDASAFPALTKAMKDRDHRASNVRMQAATVLGKIGDRAAVPALTEALKDQYGWVRGQAAIALGEIGDVSTVPALIKALKDEDRDVRNGAADGLREMGDSETLPRKILATLQFSAQQKIEGLDALRRVRGYRFPDTLALCQIVLEEDNAEASAGAQAVLDRFAYNILVRASQRDASNQPQELLRATQAGTSEVLPETLLRGTVEPEEDARQPLERRTLRDRLLGKRKNGGT